MTDKTPAEIERRFDALDALAKETVQKTRAIVGEEGFAPGELVVFVAALNAAGRPLFGLSKVAQAVQKVRVFEQMT